MAMQAKKYVQSHTVNGFLNQGLRSSRGMLPEFDSIAEAWLESEEKLMEAMSSAERRKFYAALLEDEGDFVKHTKSSECIVIGA